jgi:hypothetical protein
MSIHSFIRGRLRMSRKTLIRRIVENLLYEIKLIIQIAKRGAAEKNRKASQKQPSESNEF